LNRARNSTLTRSFGAASPATEREESQAKACATSDGTLTTSAGAGGESYAKNSSRETERDSGFFAAAALNDTKARRRVGEHGVEPWVARGNARWTRTRTLDLTPNPFP